MTAAASTNMEPSEIVALRAAHYNATISAVVQVNADLRIIRVIPDNGVCEFHAGQYFTLGLGNWEARVAGVDEEHLSAQQQTRCCQRAYSASCSMLDESGQLKVASDFGYLEFYLALVRHAERHPPALTPRLFALNEGDRLFVSSPATGRYTLGCVEPDGDVFFFATGTGEAPHNAMIAELLSRGHRGRIVSAVSVRYLRDAAYRMVHRELARRFPNYHYFLSATRETSNSPAREELDGTQRLQAVVSSGLLERRSGVELNPAKTHVFLCGNPAMIGLLPHKEPDEGHFEAGSMLDLLLRRGFQPAKTEQAGNVHFERYW